MNKKALLLPAAFIFVPLITVILTLYAGALIRVGTFRHVEKRPVVSELKNKNENMGQARQSNQIYNLKKTVHFKQNPQGTEVPQKVTAARTNYVYDRNPVIQAPIVDKGAAIAGPITGVNPNGTVRVNNVA